MANATVEIPEDYWVWKAIQTLGDSHSAIKILPLSAPVPKPSAVELAEKELGPELSSKVRIILNPDQEGSEFAGKGKKRGTSKGKAVSSAERFPCTVNLLHPKGEWCSGLGDDPAKGFFCKKHEGAEEDQKQARHYDVTGWHTAIMDLKKSGTAVRAGKGYLEKVIKPLTTKFLSDHKPAK